MGLPFRFSKPANLYFLFLMCLQTIPEVTVTGQIPTIAFPLVWLSFLSFCLWPMSKDGDRDERPEGRFRRLEEA